MFEMGWESRRGITWRMPPKEKKTKEKKKKRVIPRVLSRRARQNVGRLLTKNFFARSSRRKRRLPLINALRARRSGPGVDNWNYVKKTCRKKKVNARRRTKRDWRRRMKGEKSEKKQQRGNKGTRCRHVTDVIDDRARDPLRRTDVI